MDSENVTNIINTLADLASMDTDDLDDAAVSLYKSGQATSGVAREYYRTLARVAFSLSGAGRLLAEANEEG